MVHISNAVRLVKWLVATDEKGTAAGPSTGLDDAPR
jgi:hypothetical protein